MHHLFIEVINDTDNHSIETASAIIYSNKIKISQLLEICNNTGEWETDSKTLRQEIKMLKAKNKMMSDLCSSQMRERNWFVKRIQTLERYRKEEKLK